MDGVGDGMRSVSTVVEMMGFLCQGGEESDFHGKSSICSCLEFSTDVGEVTFDEAENQSFHC